MIYSFVIRSDLGVINKIISFDSVTDVSRSLSGTVTSNAVENGLPISDHMSLENPKFDITGVVTSYNILDEALELVWNNGAFESTGDSSTTDRHLEIEAELENLWKDRVVFSILRTKGNSSLSDNDQKYAELSNSKVSEYMNCVITGLTFSDQVGEYNIIRPKMSIEQVNVAYVSKQTLTDEEQQPTLTAVKKQPRQVGSASTSKTNAKDEAGTGVSEKPTDNSNTSKLLKDDGSNAKNLAEVAKLKRQIADRALGVALQEQAKVIQATGGVASVVANPEATGFTLERK